LRYFMQTSRVNGLTSGVFAFLVPASCLNLKGSDTCRDNTTFPVADYYLHLPVFVTETPGARKTCFFPFPRGGATEQREGVSYDVPVTADRPLLYSAILRSSAAVFWHRGF
ncbi:hypothetical protein, partial [Citrobacter freundii]